VKQTLVTDSDKLMLYCWFTGVKNHIFNRLAVKSKISVNSARYRKLRRIDEICIITSYNQQASASTPPKLLLPRFMYSVLFD